MAAPNPTRVQSLAQWARSRLSSRVMPNHGKAEDGGALSAPTRTGGSGLQGNATGQRGWHALWRTVSHGGRSSDGSAPCIHSQARSLCFSCSPRNQCRSDSPPRPFATGVSHSPFRPVNPRNLWLFLCMAVTQSLMAGDLQSWSDVDITVLDTDPVELTVGGTVRLRNSLGSLYDRRATTEATVALSDRLDLRLAYLLRNQALPKFVFGSDHRLVAGLSYPILRRSVTLVGTTLYERHLGRPDIPDFNRYRQQVDLEQSCAPVSPWFHQSLAFRRTGFIRTRSRFGFRWRFASGHSLRGAYQFESYSSSSTWRPRHTIVTEWKYDLVSKDRRPR